MALTEKGTQRIEIIVRKAGGVDVAGAKDKEPEEANQESQDQNQDGKGTKKSIKTKAFWRAQITHSAAVAKQLAMQWFNYSVAGIGYKHGDQAMQQLVERQVEQVSDVTNLASSLAMGATYGSMGGPMGSMLGMLMMGSQTASALAVKYATRQRDYDMTLFKQNNAIEYKRARAQINLTTGRLR